VPFYFEKIFFTFLLDLTQDRNLWKKMVFRFKENSKRVHLKPQLSSSKQHFAALLHDIFFSVGENNHGIIEYLVRRDP